MHAKLLCIIPNVDCDGRFDIRLVTELCGTAFGTTDSPCSSYLPVNRPSEQSDTYLLIAVESTDGGAVAVAHGRWTKALRRGLLIPPEMSEKHTVVLAVALLLRPL